MAVASSIGGHSMSAFLGSKLSGSAGGPLISRLRWTTSDEYIGIRTTEANVFVRFLLMPISSWTNLDCLGQSHIRTVDHLVLRAGERATYPTGAHPPIVSPLEIRSANVMLASLLPLGYSWQYSYYNWARSRLNRKFPTDLAASAWRLFMRVSRIIANRD